MPGHQVPCIIPRQNGKVSKAARAIRNVEERYKIWWVRSRPIFFLTPWKSVCTSWQPEQTGYINWTWITITNSNLQLQNLWHKPKPMSTFHGHGIKSAQRHQIYAGPLPKTLWVSSCPTIKTTQHPYAPAAPGENKSLREWKGRRKRWWNRINCEERRGEERWRGRKKMGKVHKRGKSEKKKNCMHG